jgi:hypothetical protein
MSVSSNLKIDRLEQLLGAVRFRFPLAAWSGGGGGRRLMRKEYHAHDSEEYSAVGYVESWPVVIPKVKIQEVDHRTVRKTVDDVTDSAS